MQCLICDGRGRRGENFETQFCQAEALQISYSPTSKTFTPSQGCHQGLPSIALWYLMGITETESGPNTKQGLLSFSLEGTGDPKEVWEMPKRVAFLWQLHFLTVQFCATQQLCSKAQFVSQHGTLEAKVNLIILSQTGIFNKENKVPFITVRCLLYSVLADCFFSENCILL